MVSVLAFFSNNPSSKPTRVYNFSVKIVVENDKNQHKRGRGWPIKRQQLNTLESLQVHTGASQNSSPINSNVQNGLFVDSSSD